MHPQVPGGFTKLETFLKRDLMGLVLSLCLCPAAAQENATPPSPEPPQLVPEVQTGKVPEAEVTIVEQDGKKLEKYSVNGQVYMVKVISGNAPPYYLLDLDGDGVMDVTRDSPDNISVPQWVLFSW